MDDHGRICAADSDRREAIRTVNQRGGGWQLVKERINGFL
jgi:hypothetical protein